MGELIKKHNKPLGASGTDVVGNVHNASDHIETLQGYQAAETYDKMRRSDTQVRKILGAITAPIRASKWSIESFDDESQSLEISSLMDHILFKDINWSKFLNEALTMVPHGYACFEPVHINKTDRDFGDYTGIAQLGFRRQATIIEWHHDNVTGELQSIKQSAAGDIEVQDVVIPAEFLLLFFAEQEGDNIGFPLLRNVYGPYKRKLLATELQFIGIERFAIPTPLLQIPKGVNQDDSEYIEAVAVLKNFTSAEDSYLTYPEGWDLTLHTNSFDPEKLTRVIKSEDENMASAILASFLELGTGGNAGAYALSADLSDFFFSGLSYYANVITDVVNEQLIKTLVRLNYGPEEHRFPRLIYSGITDNAGKELSEVLTALASAGMITPDEPLEDHVRKIYNLPKKVEGEMVENAEQEDEENPTDPTDPDAPADPALEKEDTEKEEVELDEPEEVKLSDASLGHRHAGTGPEISRGGKHYHDLLDDSGEKIGRTSAEKDTPEHTHEGLGKRIEIKPTKELKDNPAALIDKHAAIIVEVVRRHLTNISDKYIADVLKNYRSLGDSKKLLATKGVKIGGTAQFRKELKGALTSSAREALEQVQKEVPTEKTVKFKEVESELLKEFEMDSFKFSDFSKLPKRAQIIIARQAELISEKEARSVADTVAFQFGSSEPTTNDIDVLKNDLKQAADDAINSGTKNNVAADAVATAVGNTRNQYLLDDDVQDMIASYTFYNRDPKTEVCQTLTGSTYEVTDPDIVRWQPPLHHNCQSYLRANLKTSRNLPKITKLPNLSDKAKKQATFKGN